MQNTYLYIRFSDDKQSEGSSYARQLQLARNHCPTLIEDKEHIFFDAGKSAFHSMHLEDGGELKRFYDAVKDGLVPKGSTLLVEDLDRMSRAGMWKASDKLRELTENGIAVVTLRDGKRYSGVLNFSDAITSLLKQELANEESAKKSNRISLSYLDRYSKARMGIKVKVLLPGWLEWQSFTKPYAFKEPEATIARRIFTMSAAGHSYAAICKEFNQEEIPPFRGRGKGKVWITASVYAIVKGRAAIGEYAPRDGGPPIPGYFPALVDTQLFDAAQGARAERKAEKVTKSSAAINIWSKVAICALCRKPLHSQPKGRFNTRYLVCSWKMGGVCEAKNISEKRSETVFRELLAYIVNADVFNGQQKQVVPMLRQLAGQIDEKQKLKARQVALLDENPLPELVAAIKKLNAAIGSLEAEKTALELQAAQALKIESSKAAMMKRIALDSREERMDANSLLKRLQVTVAIARFDTSIRYTVEQGGHRILELTDHNGETSVVAYNEETALRMASFGEIDEEVGGPAHSVSLSNVTAKRKLLRLLPD